ncbi:unnamed protein product [Clavelina lepadiformis]|uniref:Uncharacterized protein n=1 Tax=Clavelina lepadiformis TaxID=159417 RepID=A0ABP0GF20_CLALP
MQLRLFATSLCKPERNLEVDNICETPRRSTQQAMHSTKRNQSSRGNASNCLWCGNKFHIDTSSDNTVIRENEFDSIVDVVVNPVDQMLAGPSNIKLMIKRKFHAKLWLKDAFKAQDIFVIKILKQPLLG